MVSKVAFKKKVSLQQQAGSASGWVLNDRQTVIGKVLETRGGGLYSVLAENGDDLLVSLPKKFQKQLWIRKGSFVQVEPFKDPTGKVLGEIVSILLLDDIKDLQAVGSWPAFFADHNGLGQDDTNKDSDSDGASLFRNPNHYQESDED